VIHEELKGMANQKQLDLLRQGVEVWNTWRQEHSEVQPDLREAFLKGVSLQGADLKKANLNWAYLIEADLREADLKEAHLFGTILVRADLRKADLRGAIFFEADLSEAHLDRADLRGANLSRARLVRTHLTGARLTNCRVYGISAWDMQLEGAEQFNLIITPLDQPSVTVDNLEVAQFVYLLLNNKKIRDVINTIGQKGVLILGRFSKERKLVLDALRDKLRALNFLPIVFDFERPTGQDFTETIMTLAGLSCFIIADITNPKSTPLELQATVPNYMIPFVPIIQKDEQPFSMFQDLKRKYRDWVLDTLVYDTPSHLIQGLEEAVVKPALEKRAVLLSKKVEEVRMRDIKDYLKPDFQIDKQN
jgi:uncharacterized protein YjbI with pentapeptide repeats